MKRTGPDFSEVTGDGKRESRLVADDLRRYCCMCSIGACPADVRAGVVRRRSGVVVAALPMVFGD